MKIVDRKTFLALPAGTVFQKFQPCAFEEISVKWDTTAGVDYVVQRLDPWFQGDNDDGDLIATLAKIQAGEPSPPIDLDFAGRDGLFDQNQLFAVWSDADVEALIALFQSAQTVRRAAETGTETPN